MASGTFYGSTSNKYITPKINWSAVTNQAENYSDVYAELRYSRNNSGYTTAGPFYGSLFINGQEIKVSNKRITIEQNSDTLAISGTVRVYHDADGSKTISIYATGYIQSNSLSSTNISSYVTLDTIDKNVYINSFGLLSRSYNSASFYLNVSHAIDRLQYSLNNGSWVDASLSNNSFVISNLNAETEYSVKVLVKRADSQFTRESSTISFTTDKAPVSNDGRIKINNVWKKGTIYLKVNGIWKKVKPYIKVNGVWKGSF